ncbi:glycosyltransferase [Leptolyngbya sp. AN03gr2]|uniref:glycosyltransferase n=1 Tax=unclassified Leptolyngbya TaxID=2650499 RepID=UPI003D312810
MSTLAIFAPNLHGGGAERAMVNLARGFSEQGVSVDLVLVKAEGAYLGQVPPNVRVVNLNHQRVLASLFDLARYLQRERPQVLLSTLPEPGIAAVWTRLLSGVPTRVVVNVQNNTSQETQNGTGLAARLMPRLIQWFFPWADAIVTVSKGVADDLRQIGLSESKIRVIHNPVVTPELIVRSQESVDHPWFAKGEPPVIIAVGRLTKQKDFPTLLKAFAQVRKVREARLMILGEGDDRAVLEALVQKLDIADSVALPGFVSNPFAYLSKSAVFVLSSLFEGLPTVLIEAMAVGTSVVATDCKSGPMEILDNGKYGKLTQVGETDGLAKAIVEILDHPTDSTLLQQRAKEYSLEKSLQDYAELFALSHHEKQIA